MAYSCKVLADSVGDHGCRITTFEVCFPRIILPQLRTYGMLSYSVRSSRAVPIKTLINEVETDPFIPAVWRKSQKGMTAGELMDADERDRATAEWLAARTAALESAKVFADMGAAKEHANRLLEPFSWSWAVITGTHAEWGWFFQQRCNDAAQPEIQHLANMMLTAKARSEPSRLEVGQWHLPYSDEGDYPRLSAARCARVSYKPFDAESADTHRDQELASQLWASGHLSPFEHVAMCCATPAYRSKLAGWMSYRHREGR